jgi:hypothetical protein
MVLSNYKRVNLLAASPGISTSMTCSCKPSILHQVIEDFPGKSPWLRARAISFSIVLFDRLSIAQDGIDIGGFGHAKTLQSGTQRLLGGAVLHEALFVDRIIEPGG